MRDLIERLEKSAREKLRRSPGFPGLEKMLDWQAAQALRLCEKTTAEGVAAVTELSEALREAEVKLIRRTAALVASDKRKQEAEAENERLKKYIEDRPASIGLAVENERLRAVVEAAKHYCDRPASKSIQPLRDAIERTR